MKGTLTLIPTPIDEESPLEQVALARLKDAFEKEREKSVFAIEDLKPGRRRWIRFGLPREAVDEFVLYNEHTSKQVSSELLKDLQQGSNVYLMSDGGLPAFCDPGRKLVELCHQHGIRVTATPFPNSIALAIALSGFNHDRFYFAGFLSAKKDERIKQLDELLARPETLVVMDTPYRLTRLLEDLVASGMKREVFIGCDLGSNEEITLRVSIKEVLKKLRGEKREFILVINSIQDL